MGHFWRQPEQDLNAGVVEPESREFHVGIGYRSGHSLTEDLDDRGGVGGGSRGQSLPQLCRLMRR